MVGLLVISLSPFDARVGHRKPATGLICECNADRSETRNRTTDSARMSFALVLRRGFAILLRRNVFANTWSLAVGRAISVAAAVLLVLLAAVPTSAQELEPRAYRYLPSGLNFATLAYTYSSGNVLVDPTGPIQDLSANLHVTTAGYGRSFGLFGRAAAATVSSPYVYMSASGTLAGEFLEGSRSGWGDARARLTVNLLGGPALSMSQFAATQPGRSFGLGLAVAMPTGQYDSARLINFGANRWGFKPEIGYSSVDGNWIFEASAGVWLFTANNDGFEGSKVQQDPIGSLQGHLSYNFPRRVWLAFDVNYFTGGRTTVDGAAQGGLQKSSRVGLTLSFPLRTSHSLKISTQTGAYTRLGADFDTLTLAYQYQWTHDR